MYALYSFHFHCVYGGVHTEAVSSGVTALIGFAARIKSVRFGIAFAVTLQALSISLPFYFSSS